MKVESSLFVFLSCLILSCQCLLPWDKSWINGQINSVKAGLMTDIRKQRTTINNLEKRLTEINTQNRQDSNLIRILKNTQENMTHQIENEIHNILESVKNQEEQSLNFKISVSETEKKLQKQVQDTHDKLWNSLQNIITLRAHRAKEVDENINNVYERIKQHELNEDKKYEELKKALRDVSAKSEANQNASESKIQKEIEGTRNEISSDLAAQKAVIDNLAKRVTAVDTRNQHDNKQLLELKDTLEYMNNQTEINMFDLRKLVTNLQKESVNIKTSIFEKEKNLETQVQEKHDKLSNSLENIITLRDNRAKEVDKDIKNIYDKIEQQKLNGEENYDEIKKALLNVLRKEVKATRTEINKDQETQKAFADNLAKRVAELDTSYEKLNKALLNVVDRVDLISISLTKQIILESQHTASIAEKQKQQELKFKQCCRPSDA